VNQYMYMFDVRVVQMFDPVMHLVNCNEPTNACCLFVTTTLGGSSTDDNVVDVRRYTIILFPVGFLDRIRTMFTVVPKKDRSFSMTQSRKSITTLK
jgi:hypothetical protein